MENFNLFTEQEGKTNKNCTLARNGFRPYERCNYCELNVKSCSGMHLNLFTFFAGFSILMFLFLDDPMLIRINIIWIIGLVFAFGYKVTVDTDSLARVDFMNKNLNEELHNHSSSLEDQVEERTKELQNLAVHDKITGLYNRYEFEKRLTSLLKYSSRASDQSVMCYIDLDQFKIVNDTSGHVAGDELLKQISFLMQISADENDIVARLGGDEFGILFVGNTMHEAYEKAEAILSAIKKYRFSWKQKIFVVGASMGLVPITRSCCSIIDVISAADTACYEAKEEGRNRIHIASKNDEKLQAKRGEMQWLSRLTKALEDEEFILYIQPIVPLLHKEDTIKHYEVLIRMKDKDSNIILPMAFIPAAERYGLMQKIDRWVIRNLFKKYSKLKTTKDICCTFSINLSGNSLADKTLSAYIEALFKTYDIEPESICFEVTETAAVANMDTAIEFIKRMRELGCKTSLDDFGSGLSSFAYLKNIPVDYLKIDGVFVNDLDKDEINRAMVKSINEVSHIMGIQTICEYVETKEVKDILEEMDVDFAQGHYYAEAKSIEILF